MIFACDFNFSIQLTIHDDLPFDYMSYHELQHTPIGMNLTTTKKLLHHPDSINLLQQACPGLS